MRIEAARASDLAGIRWLLEYEQLPSEDVSEQLLAHFLVYRDEKGVVGAEGFFAARGYRTLQRAEAPLQIQRSSQFSRLCPATAVLMVKP